jgi:hypothetical protein
MGLLIGSEENYYKNENLHGKYQFVTLQTIIDQFLISYVGDNKIIPRINKYEVDFHAQRAMQELSFDTFKSCKSQEITLRPNLQMTLPQDYVNYTKISWVDGNGIKHRIQPTSNTSNPTPMYTNEEGGHKVLATGTITSGSPNIVLEGEHADILVGMKLRGSHAHLGLDSKTVLSVSTTAGVTTVVMSANATSTYTLPGPLEFVFVNADIPKDSKPFSLPNVSTSSIGNKHMSHGTTIDGNYSKIKVGMLVHSDAFPKGTKVVSVTPTLSSPNVMVISVDKACTAILTTAQVIFSDLSPDSDTWSSYKSGQSDKVDHHHHNHDHDHNVINGRYGLDPQHANINGSFYMDCDSGKINFSSDLVGRVIVLDYISDGVGTNNEMQVHKFAEEAMYKWIAHGILSTTMNIPEGLIARFKRERFAAVRNAKLRLSNIKLEEITQILRGKSKHIKH